MRRWFQKLFRRKKAGAEGSGQGPEGQAAGSGQGADGQARGVIVTFHTMKLEAKPTWITHTVAWDSSTGRAADLGHLKTREKVSWASGAPPAFGPPSEYTHPGQHTGIGQCPGSACRNSDDHRIVPDVFTMEGALADGQKTARWTMQQVYQYAEMDSNDWHDIAGARYSITRWIERKKDSWYVRHRDVRTAFILKESVDEHPPVTFEASIRVPR
jgi:hypothetical protein